jgi:hypothetical protein
MVKAIAIGFPSRNPKEKGETIKVGDKAEVIEAAQAALKDYREVKLSYFPLCSKKMVNDDWQKPKAEAPKPEPEPGAAEEPKRGRPKKA